MADNVRHIRANGIGFRMVERGSGEPLILLHGFTGSAASWFSINDDLAQDHRVVAIDLIGHGGSEAPVDLTHYAFEQAVDDLAEIASQPGINRAAWLGYSMGGRLALGLALRHPKRVAALILESAAPGIRDEDARIERRAADEALARRIEEIGMEAFVAEWERLPPWDSQRSLPVEILRRQREARLGNLAIGLANSLRGMGQGAQSSFWDRLGEVDAPVLLVAGALDAKFAGIAAQMRAAMPHAALRIVPHAGHAVHLERPRTFVDAVGEFLARHRRLAMGTPQETTR